MNFLLGYLLGNIAKNEPSVSSKTAKFNHLVKCGSCSQEYRATPMFSKDGTKMITVCPCGRMNIQKIT